jgi:hypothetical protein
MIVIVLTGTGQFQSFHRFATFQSFQTFAE